MAKVKMKVSGGFRSKTGAEAYTTRRGASTTLRSYIETARKQAHNAFKALVNSP